MPVFRMIGENFQPLRQNERGIGIKTTSGFRAEVELKL
jgi:hypothetical protein